MDACQIGKRIQQVRKERGLTQEQLSQMVDLSPNYLSNVETGVKTPKLETLIEIINALGCDANTLLADVVDTTTTESSSAIAKDLASLPVKDQRRILRVVEVLIADARNEL